MVTLLIKEEIVIGLKIPTQPMSEQLAVQIPRIATTEANSMRREKKVIKIKGTTTNVARIMIKEGIVTNTTINLETDLETIMDNATIVKDEMANPGKLIKVVEIKNKISAGNNVKFVTKTVTIGF